MCVVREYIIEYAEESVNSFWEDQQEVDSFTASGHAEEMMRIIDGDRQFHLNRSHKALQELSPRIWEVVREVPDEDNPMETSHYEYRAREDLTKQEALKELNERRLQEGYEESDYFHSTDPEQEGLDAFS